MVGKISQLILAGEATELPTVIQIDTTRSAATVSSARVLGVMNWAFLAVKSSSETPRAFPQRPQTYTGIPCSITLGSSSRRAGRPTAWTCSAMASFIR